MNKIVEYIKKIELENKELKEKNEKLIEGKEIFRLRSCKRNQELVEALHPFKKDYQDHKRIIETIKELKKQNQNLMKQCCSENRTIQLLIRENENLKETIQELKDENKKLQEFKKQAEDECSNSAVFEKMIDEIRELEGELEILKEKH